MVVCNLSSLSLTAANLKNYKAIFTFETFKYTFRGVKMDSMYSSPMFDIVYKFGTEKWQEVRAKL